MTTGLRSEQGAGWPMWRMLFGVAALGLIVAACDGGEEAGEEPATEPAVTGEAPATTPETPAGTEGEATPAETAAGTEAAEQLETPRVAFTSPVQPSFVNTRYGPITYGPDFGLDVSEDDFTVFDSHSTATQTALSGRADVVGGSFISHVLVRETGQDFKVFCPFVSLDDFVLVGSGGVDSIEDLFDPETRVAVDSPGGAGAMILNALLVANDAQGTVEDLPNTTVLESSGLRTTAFASGDADATIIHLPQFHQASEQLEDATIITSLYEDVPVYLKEAFAAPSAWLEENSETAAAFCASILTANRELPEDFELFMEAVQTYVEEPPDEEELQELHGLVQEHEFWPTDGGLEQDAVEFMVDLGVTSGLLEERPENLDQIVDRDVLDRAVELADQGG